MKIGITSFYNVRNLERNQIPMSTALYDPKWYHDFQGNGYIFKDKRGVYNGIRLEELSPRGIEAECCKGCELDSNNCSFKTKYRELIYSLDFDSFINKMKGYLEVFRKATGEEGEIVLLVHEQINNPCSERWILIDWLKDNGIKVENF